MSFRFFLSSVLAVFFFALPALAQKPDANKPDKEKLEQYQTRLKAIGKDDWDGRVKLANWCQENNLKAQAKTLLTEVIKAKPDHEEARKLLGYVKYQGQWVLDSDLEKIRQKEREKEYKEKGYVQWKGQWVPAADVSYLDRGLIKIGDQWVTKEDKEKMDKGYLLVDGEWISPEDAEKVKQGLFKIDKDKWVGLEEANQFHSNWATPWKIHTTHFILYTNIERKLAEELKTILEEAYTRVYELFKVELKEKAAILAIGTDKDYQNFMGRFAGHHSSVWGGSLAEGHPDRPGVIAYKSNEKPYIPLYLAHAVAHVYLDRVAKRFENLPTWFLEGVAEYVSRYHTPELKKWTIANIVNKGGLGSLTAFTSKMEINSETYDQSQQSLKCAGLLISYILNGGNESVKKAFTEAVEIIPKGDPKKIEKAVNAILAKPDQIEKELKAYLEANK